MKTTIYTVVITITLFTTFLACTTSDKKETTKTTATTMELPDVDIHTAVITGNIEAVQQYVKATTAINDKEAMSGSTPLITAVTFNKPAIAKTLINAGADLSIQNNDGSTALHVAAFFGRIEMVQLLLDAKADKNIRNNFGATARESVLGNFADVKPIYEMLQQQLQPMGFELDLQEVEKARPVIAIMLQ